MPVYDRTKPGAKRKSLWISYTITEEQRKRHGRRSRTVREPAGTGNMRDAEKRERDRINEVKRDVWVPRGRRDPNTNTVAAYGEKWLTLRKKNGVIRVDVEALFLRSHVFPRIGEMPIDDVQRKHIVELVSSLKDAISIRTKRPLAPRTVHGIYRTLSTLFQQAVIDEVVTRSPCNLTVRREELPEKDDADPEWRQGAVFTRDEVETLISDKRVPPARRAFYAVMFFTGMRIGEVIGRRWRDYDPVATPLGRLVIATQYSGKRTKKRKVRECPVHPVLASVLARWRLQSWPEIYGRSPTPDDYIVPVQLPKPDGTFPCQTYRRAYNNLQMDLERVGLRPRRAHDTRRTFVSLARADGARGDLLIFVTHGATQSMMDIYTTPEWKSLCEQVACLRLSIREVDNVVELRPRNHPVKR
jgi:integrase